MIPLNKVEIQYSDPTVNILNKFLYKHIRNKQ